MAEDRDLWGDGEGWGLDRVRIPASVRRSRSSSCKGIYRHQVDLNDRPHHMIQHSCFITVMKRIHVPFFSLQTPGI